MIGNMKISDRFLDWRFLIQLRMSVCSVQKLWRYQILKRFLNYIHEIKSEVLFYVVLSAVSLFIYLSCLSCQCEEEVCWWTLVQLGPKHLPHRVCTSRAETSDNKHWTAFREGGKWWIMKVGISLHINSIKNWNFFQEIRVTLGVD